MITALLFDLDGLLADTERLQTLAYQRALALFGVALSAEEYASHWIQKGGGIVQFLAERAPAINAEAVRREKARIYEDLLASDLVEMPGASQLLQQLQGRKRLAVASANYRRSVETVCRLLDFTRYLEVIAAREDVSAAKPAPDVFLYAARRLGVDPAECVVLEDAEKGILAARAAGMRSIAIPNAFTRGNDFSAATYVVNALSEAHALLDLDG